MKCSSIKLEQRRKLQRNCKENNSKCVSENIRCTFPWINPRRKASTVQQCLTITHLILPSTIQPFNTGTSIERWANKRARLKSAKRPSARRTIIIVTPPPSPQLETLRYYCASDDEEAFAGANSVSEIPQEQLDPDIRKLLEETHVNEGKNEVERGMSCELSQNKSCESEGSNSKSNKRRRNGESRKRRNKDKERRRGSRRDRTKKLTKTVSFTLSKPPSPETEQVIRVEVVSNYSIDLRDEDSESDVNGDGVEGHPEKNPNGLFNKSKINRPTLVGAYIPKLNNRKEEFLIRSKKLILVEKY